ncbi:NAD(P)/FAD-dependent oxidoreductase [Salisediminibacterium selenitireducens]|uniref:FAD dependent oxidoreductase n=1 Tax=Bacillus selenitireducens (strain ATCC 700615 / DSM 15326 / MLS10) TaxID=439292 RepID=D6Y055_BACIE|nr:NAD(P)/FAD-dependent oxidoreductase [Salisediminibacterium selenitireducens]ADH98446.1 FAD dependent oxidoreductase [[Bacillus] selenitireducens MLS10]
MYDVVIIGGGITGTTIARTLSTMNLKTVLLEKDNDVANGTTKANSAIVHAGFDCTPGTAKARTNVAGNQLYPSLCRMLDVPFRQNGSLVLAFDEKDRLHLETLVRQGQANFVPGIRIVEREELQAMEPNVSKDAIAALYAPTAGIVGSYELAIACMENAMDNGVELRLNHQVIGIEEVDDGFVVETNKQLIHAKVVINAAGLYADVMDAMVHGEARFDILPYAGEYNLFDQSTGDFTASIVFQPPSEKGKGVVALPTVEGNYLVGPTSEGPKAKDDLRTTRAGLKELREKGERAIPGFPFHKVITSFSGLRAKTSGGDFIIGDSDVHPGFISAAAIDSPGLTAAPAIAEEIFTLTMAHFPHAKENKLFNPTRRPVKRFMEAPVHHQKVLLEEEERFGRMICRCESITEGDIIDMIYRHAGAETLDGVKRRIRAGAGRCQGGFCSPRVMEILARELNRDITEIVKDGEGSFILTGETKVTETEEKETETVHI